MSLLTQDLNAKDSIYLKIQQDNDLFDPPSTWRDHVELLYEITKPLLDKNFCEEIKHNFCARYAEMYFAATLVDCLCIKLNHISDEGLDFYAPELNSWFEVIAATDGSIDLPNSLVPRNLNECTRHPEERIILRLTNAFVTKAKKVKEDINKGIVKPNERVVICISGGGLSEWVPSYPYPEIVKSLLPIGDLVLWIQRDAKAITEHEFNYRSCVEKIKKIGFEEIRTDYFLNKDYSHISAVIYSYSNFWNPPVREKFGSDFFIVHNPLAENPLPKGTIWCGAEYLVSADSNSFTINSVLR